MSTRGAFGFRINGTDKITFNRWDSYPEGLGKCLRRDIQTFTDDELRVAAVRIELVDNSEFPTDAQRLTCTQWAGKDGDETWGYIPVGAPRPAVHV